MAGRDTDEPGAAGPWPAAAALAPMVDVWRRLLVDHAPTPDGRCRTCTQGGTGLPAARWPCGPHHLAEAAARCSGDGSTSGATAGLRPGPTMGAATP